MCCCLLHAAVPVTAAASCRRHVQQPLHGSEVPGRRKSAAEWVAVLPVCTCSYCLQQQLSEILMDAPVALMPAMTAAYAEASKGLQGSSSGAVVVHAVLQCVSPPGVNPNFSSYIVPA